MRVTTMHVDDLIELYDYCYWANGQLLGALTPLTPEEFTRDGPGALPAGGEAAHSGRWRRHAE